MKTKRVEQIIREIRRRSNNIEWGSMSGISDDTISQILNGAKDRLQALILSTIDSTAFTDEHFFTTISGQEKYLLPVDMLDYNSIVTVDIKVGDNWQPLDPRTLREREAGFTGLPYAYIRDGREILLKPIPQESSSQVRVTYTKRLNDLSTLMKPITSTGAGYLAVDPNSGTDMDIYIFDTFSVYDSISVVDVDGTILNSFSVEFDEVNNRFNLIGDVDDYTSLLNKKITMGQNSSNYLFDVDPVMSEYLIQYGADYLNLIDSNGDVSTSSARLQSLEDQILTSYNKEDKDIILVPDLNKRGY